MADNPNIPKQQINIAIETIKHKMGLMNFNNLQPPFFLHTLTKYRQTFLSPLLEGMDSTDAHKLRLHLSKVHHIIAEFDDQCFDSYTSELIEPYTRKMFQDNYEFDAIDFKEANQNYHLKSEIQETLAATAEWLTQTEVTQDLLDRVDLYFKLKVPHLAAKIRQQAIASEKNTWGGSIVSLMKRLTSFGLRKGSKMVQSTFFTTLAPSALMLTLAIMGGSASLPWKMDLNAKSLVPAIAVISVPYILDSMANGVEKSDITQKLRRWAICFSGMAENITKFNEKLEEAIRNCAIASSLIEFEKERTNLEKIISALEKGAESVIQFDESSFEDMRDRTEAYFREYIEVQQGDWTLVFSKEEFERQQKQSEAERQQKQSEAERQQKQTTEFEHADMAEQYQKL